MRDRSFVPPVQRVDLTQDTADVDPLGTFDRPGDDGPRFRLDLEDEERALLVRLLGELRALLTNDPTEATAPLLHRLFPPAFHDDPEKEAEYQRLMREELVASRVTAIHNVSAMLEPPEDGNRADGADGSNMTEAETMAFMQSVNAVRLVLGTMLDITDEDSAEDADEGDSPEHGLYGYLGWLLEWTVRALSS